MPSPNSSANRSVFWIIRTGAPWRDLPPDYGDWKNIHRRYSRWRDRGVWEDILEALIDEPDFEWLMIDASYVKVHAHGLPVRMPVTAGKVADSSEALVLTEGVEAQHLLADKGYDSNAIVEGVSERGMNLVILSRTGRRTPATGSMSHRRTPPYRTCRTLRSMTGGRVAAAEFLGVSDRAQAL